MNNTYTIMLPVANNLPLANECINHLLSVTDIPIIVIDDGGVDENYPKSDQLKFIHNTITERPGLAKIWNQCIRECPTEYVIIASWRPRPDACIFDKIKQKLDEGFGLVAMETLHFFAFSKHLTTTMGWFDTGFTKGQFEDTDTFNRLFVNDIALYIADEIREVPHQSMWLDFQNNKDYFHTKWKEESPNLIQFREEVNIKDREIYKGKYSDRVYKPFSESELKVPGVKNYYTNLFRIPIKRFAV